MLRVEPTVFEQMYKSFNEKFKGYCTARLRLTSKLTLLVTFDKLCDTHLSTAASVSWPQWLASVCQLKLRMIVS